MADPTKKQPTDPRTLREENLRAISRDPTEPVHENELFGFIPSGGYETSLSPSEQKTVRDIGSQIFGSDFAKKNIEEITPSQWTQIQKQAGGTLKGYRTADKTKAEAAAATSKTSPEDAYQQLADTQAEQYLQQTKNLDPLTSGATLPAIESTASQNASQMLGASSTSPVSQWLNAQTSAAQAQNAPALAAESQLSSAQDSAANLMASGIKNMGSAESQMMQAAPYQQLLSSLAADVPYKLLSGYTMPQIQTTLQQSEQGLGLSTTSNPTAPTPQLPTLNPGIIPAAPTTGTAAPGVTG